MIVDESGVAVELLNVEDAGTFTSLCFGFLSPRAEPIEVNIPLDDADANRLVVALLAILEGRHNVLPQ